MNIPYLGDRKCYEDAAQLIEIFGTGAGCEAASRADRSRDLGNYLHFCHWRQTERMIMLLSMDQPIGTIH